jgi:hypothetical protein
LTRLELIRRIHDDLAGLRTFQDAFSTWRKAEAYGDKCLEEQTRISEMKKMLEDLLSFQILTEKIELHGKCPRTGWVFSHPALDAKYVVIAVNTLPHDEAFLLYKMKDQDSEKQDVGKYMKSGKFRKPIEIFFGEYNQFVIDLLVDHMINGKSLLPDPYTRWKSDDIY